MVLVGFLLVVTLPKFSDLQQQNYIYALSLPIFETIKKASENLGLETYVIGGFVRDFFLKRNQPKDIDIVTVGDGIALAQEVSKLLPHQPKVQVFKTYGTAMLRTRELEIEFVGARKESYSEDSRNPKVSTGTLEDDQKRRDFTINALALSLNTENYGVLLDPFDGISDLESGILKTPLEPNQTYSDDPLRMMRAIRFATQLGFTIESNSLNAIADNHQRLQIITKERIIEELHKIMGADKPSTGFKLLEKTKLLPQILPELIALKGVDEVEGQTHKDNFYHTLEVVDNISRTTDDLWLRWAALLHDIGKAPTKKYDKKVGWTFHAHEFVGSKMVYKLFKRLKMPLNDSMKFVQKMLLMSSIPIIISEQFVTDSAVRRLVFDAGDHIESLMMLCEADITTKNPRKQKRYKENFQRVRAKIQEVEERDRIRNFQPPVDGAEIMEVFDLQPGKEIGILKEAIKEAILEGEISNDYEEAKAFMFEKAKSMGLKPKQDV